jgi:hypothetical protein
MHVTRVSPRSANGTGRGLVGSARDRAHWIRHDDPDRIDVSARVRAGLWKGMLAGAGGVAVMTIGEKLEQRLTRRPSSYMPAHTLERVAALKQWPDRERHALNLGMHVGQAILLGAWRGLMAEGGLRGPRARHPPRQRPDAREHRRAGRTALDVAARRAGHRRPAQGRVRVHDRGDCRRARRGSARLAGGPFLRLRWRRDSAAA